MRQVGELFKFEMKKILGRKSTWIAFGVLIVFYVIQAMIPLMGESNYSSGETVLHEKEQMTEESYSETFWEQQIRVRKDGLALSGKKLDAAFLQKKERELDAISEKSGTMDYKKYMEGMQRYDMADAVIDSLTGNQSLDYAGDTPVDQQLEERRKENIASKYRKYQLTEEECAYWQKKEENVEKPFTLQYAGGFEHMIGMSGCYMSLLMVTFLAAVVVSRIFAEEHARRVDQLALSSRYGKKHLYYAKILAGCVFAILSTLLLTGMILLLTFALYGAEGASAAVQLIAGWYSYSLSMGEILLVMFGLIVLAAVLTSIFTMVISERLRNGALAMAVVIFFIVDIRLINIPSSYKVLSQIWNFWPINMVLLENFLDMRLVSLFGIKLTCWQFVPILYILACVILVLSGKRIYCRFQVEG